MISRKKTFRKSRNERGKMRTEDLDFLSKRNQLIERAASILSAPPAHDWIVRPDPLGECVQRFVLPNELCKTTNATRHGQSWALGATKKRIWELMLAQTGHRTRPAALPGRPQIIAVRFSCSESDPSADWGKFAIDMLRVWRDKRDKIPGTNRYLVRKIPGLGFIIDDRGSKTAVHQHWEPCGRRDGFTYFEIWTGASNG